MAGAALLAVARWSLLRFDNSPGTWHVTTLGQAQPLPRMEVEGYQQMPQPSRGEPGQQGKVTLGMLLIGALALLCALIAACYTASQHTASLRAQQHQAVLRCQRDRSLCPAALSCGRAAIVASQAWVDVASARAAAADEAVLGIVVDLEPVTQREATALALERAAGVACMPTRTASTSYDGGARADGGSR